MLGLILEKMSAVGRVMKGQTDVPTDASNVPTDAMTMPTDAAVLASADQMPPDLPPIVSVELYETTVIKRIRQDRDSNVVNTASAMREIYASYKITHPNVIKLRAEIAPGEIRLISPRYQCDLREFLRSNVLRDKPDVVRWVVTSILSGLSAVHAAGLIHCDVKPENVFLRVTPPALVIGDFGICALPELQRDICVQTAPYRAPEITYNDGDPHYGDSFHFTKAIDMWSVGVIMLELLIGGSPFKAHYKTSAEYVADLFGREITCPHAIMDKIEERLAEEDVPDSVISFYSISGYLSTAAKCFLPAARRLTALEALDEFRVTATRPEVAPVNRSPDWLKQMAPMLDLIPAAVLGTAASIYSHSGQTRRNAKKALLIAAMLHSFPDKIYDLMPDVSVESAIEYADEIGWRF